MLKVLIYADNTISFNVIALCDKLNSICNAIEFNSGKQLIHFQEDTISNPDSYNNLSSEVIEEMSGYDIVLVATIVPYDNNWFFDSHSFRIIISFYAWNSLTNLSVTNGFIYFLVSILCNKINLGDKHDSNTGCINDFWWDKTGVDLGMRAAFVCHTCLNSFQPDQESYSEVAVDIQTLLDLSSAASRAERDVLSYELQANKTFDVFLCHNSEDKPAIREINNHLKAANIVTWLDEEQLSPGIPWQSELEDQIENVKAAAVFIGSKGIGPWQSIEMRAFLNEFVERQCPVIPILLTDAPSIPKLPIFLKQMTYIDFRKDYQNSLLRLIGALKN